MRRLAKYTFMFCQRPSAMLEACCGVAHGRSHRGWSHCFPESGASELRGGDNPQAPLVGSQSAGDSTRRLRRHAPKWLKLVGRKCSASYRTAGDIAAIFYSTIRQRDGY